jgi:hypothetical protein
MCSLLGIDEASFKAEPDKFARLFTDLTWKSHDLLPVKCGDAKPEPLPEERMQDAMTRLLSHQTQEELAIVAKNIAKDSMHGRHGIQYEPLKSLGGIRILVFAESETLICAFREIEYNSTDAADQYTAISYAWGSDGDPETIICNGTATTVSKNFANGMRALRRHRPAANYWIDRICINQSDLDEKTRQVQLMRSIHGSAQLTAIWLGEASAFALEEAKQTILQLSDVSNIG